MERSVVLLPAELKKRIKSLSRQQGVSVAEIHRQALAVFLWQSQDEKIDESKNSVDKSAPATETLSKNLADQSLWEVLTQSELETLRAKTAAAEMALERAEKEVQETLKYLAS